MYFFHKTVVCRKEKPAWLPGGWEPTERKGGLAFFRDKGWDKLAELSLHTRKAESKRVVLVGGDILSSEGGGTILRDHKKGNKTLVLPPENGLDKNRVSPSSDSGTAQKMQAARRRRFVKGGSQGNKKVLVGKKSR